MIENQLINFLMKVSIPLYADFGKWLVFYLFYILYILINFIFQYIFNYPANYRYISF
jgi:hypothetical protein